MSFNELVKSADFKAEKHVPVIEAPASVAAKAPFKVEVSVGKEIAHPNSTEHFIGWIDLYYKSDDGKFAFNVGKVEFKAHGESVDGANKGPLYTDPHATFNLKIEKSGTLTALSYCNIHGLWESAPVKITVK